MSAPRQSIKALPSTYQERRRAAALERQRTARREAANRARKLAQAAAESEESSGSALQDGDLELGEASTSGLEPAGPEAVEVEMGGTGEFGGPSSSASIEKQPRRRRPSGASSGGPSSSSSSSRERAQRLRQQWAEQLMAPEWLIEAPQDLGRSWFVLPRPEGQRCLVITAGGHTSMRLRNGVLAQRFSSQLPGGGPGRSPGRDDSCILDCFYHQADQTFYVLDLLCWRGYSLISCPTDLRLFWVHSKLAEEGGGADAPPSAAFPRRFLPLPAYPATPAGLRAAYSSPVPFTQDGIYFLHKEAHYTPGQTPLALVWKDAACSRYLLDTDLSGAPLAQQQVVLEYRMDRTVATHDDTPAVLGRMPDAFATATAAQLRPGKLLRFAIGPGGIQYRDGQPVGADLHFLGAANQRRGRADSLSKIVFQHLARTQPITFEQLLQVAAASEQQQQQGGVAGGGAGGDGAGEGVLRVGSGGFGFGSLLQLGAGAEAQAMSTTATEGGEAGSLMDTLVPAATETDGIEVDGPCCF